jgi:glutathione S-transferase
MSLVLYELVGLNGRRYSQFSWRTRLALAHKAVQADLRAVRVSDKNAIEFSGQDKVPILVDGEKVIPDSWAIAEYLEGRDPGAPSLFGGDIGRGLSRFVNQFVDRGLVPKLVPLLMIDVVGCVDPADGDHLRSQMERVFRASLEDLAANRDKGIVTFRKSLDPVRATLRGQPFLSGASAAYADYVLFSLFQWARIVSAFEVLEEGDAVANWRTRMLDLYGGLARNEPARADASSA